MDNSVHWAMNYGAVSFETSQGFEAQATLLRLTRHMAVFEVHSPGSVLMASEILNGFKVIVRNRTIYSGRAVVKNLVATGRMLVCEATVDDSWVNIDFSASLNDRNRLSLEVASHILEWQKQYKILPEYKVHVADMQMFFVELRLWLDQMELELPSAPAEDRATVEGEVCSAIAAAIIPHIDGLFEKFELLAGRLEPELKPLHSAYLRRQLHPLVLCAPFAHRTYVKPLGYGGDYEIVNMIARNAPEGGSLFAKIVHQWFLEQAPAAAHRNRFHHLTNRLTEETLRVKTAGRRARVFNLACGPAVEVQNFVCEQDISDLADVCLLDFNQETIEYAKGTIDRLLRRNSRRTQVRVIKKSVQQILKEVGRGTNPNSDGPYDFVYCAGLFDYLTDPICQRLMIVMYQWLAPGGLLLATNVDSSNPLRNGMEHLLDWHLIYRTAKDFLRLRPADAPAESVSIKADTTGVNLFFELRKPAHG